jgi:hypothetical protein
MDLSKFLLGSAIASTTRKRVPEAEQGGPLDLRTKRCRLGDGDGTLDRSSIGPLPDLVPVEPRLYRNDSAKYSSPSNGIPDENEASSSRYGAIRGKHQNWPPRMGDSIEPAVFPSYSNIQELVDPSSMRIYDAQMSSVSTETAHYSSWPRRTAEMPSAIPRYCDTTVRNANVHVPPMPQMQKPGTLSLRDLTQPVHVPAVIAKPLFSDYFDISALPPLLSISDVDRDYHSSFPAIGNVAKVQQSAYLAAQSSPLRAANDDRRLKFNERNSFNNQLISAYPRPHQAVDNHEAFIIAGKLPFTSNQKDLSMDYTSITSQLNSSYNAVSNTLASRAWYVPSTTSCLQTTGRTTAATAVPFLTNTITTTAQHFVHSALLNSQSSVAKHMSGLPNGFTSSWSTWGSGEKSVPINGCATSVNNIALAKQTSEFIVIDDEEDEASASAPVVDNNKVGFRSQLDCTSATVSNNNPVARIASESTSGIKKSSSQTSMLSENLCKLSTFVKHKFASESNLASTDHSLLVPSPHNKKRISLLPLRSPPKLVRDTLSSTANVSVEQPRLSHGVLKVDSPQNSRGIICTDTSNSLLLLKDKVLTDKLSAVERESDNAGANSNKLYVSNEANKSPILRVPSVRSSVSDSTESVDPAELKSTVLCVDQNSDTAVVLHNRQNEIVASASIAEPSSEVLPNNYSTTDTTLLAPTLNEKSNLLPVKKSVVKMFKDNTKKVSSTKTAKTELIHDSPGNADLLTTTRQKNISKCTDVIGDKNHENVGTRKGAVAYNSVAERTTTLRNRTMTTSGTNDKTRLTLGRKVPKDLDSRSKSSNIDHIGKITRRSVTHLRTNCEPGIRSISYLSLGI